MENNAGLVSSQKDRMIFRDPRSITEIQQFKYEMMLYEAAIQIMKAKLQVLQQEFLCLTERTPIDHITTRIKSAESILDKMERKGYPLTMKSLKENVKDIAGIRIVCPFISDIYEVFRILQRQSDVHVIQVKDYVRHPKANGYRSLHVILNVEVPLSSSVREVPVELQIRTIAMNCWAGVQHQIRYKKDIDSIDMDAVLKHCAQLMTEADSSLQQLINRIPGMRDDFGIIDDTFFKTQEYSESKPE